MFAVCAPAPVTRLRGSASGTCFAGPHSPWSPPFAPPAPWQLAPPRILRSGSLHLVRRLHSYYGGVRLLVPVRHRLRLLAFPMRTRSAHGLWSDPRPPRFRRDPCPRDVSLAPTRPTIPRTPPLPISPSTINTFPPPPTNS